MGLKMTPLVECRHCRQSVPGTIDDVQARCPRCRFPLFERQETQRRAPGGMTERCVVHPGTLAVARCRRCQQWLCSICRTRWQEEVLCLDCFNNALERKEPLPRDAKQQTGQAKRSLLGAILGWTLLIASAVLYASLREGRQDREIGYVALGLFLLSFVPALTSLGQAVQVVRERGHRWRQATWCMVLAGAQIGLAVGLVLVNVRHNW